MHHLKHGVKQHLKNDELTYTTNDNFIISTGTMEITFSMQKLSLDKFSGSLVVPQTRCSLLRMCKKQRYYKSSCLVWTYSITEFWTGVVLRWPLPNSQLHQTILHVLIVTMGVIIVLCWCVIDFAYIITIYSSHDWYILTYLIINICLIVCV